MSEAKHTPGPWAVDETVALGAYGVWTEAGRVKGHDGELYAEQICSVLTVSFKNTDEREKRLERDANARLIAAAPELLTASQSAEQMCSTLLAEANLDERLRQWVFDAHNELLAVIAKATATR